MARNSRAFLDMDETMLSTTVLANNIHCSSCHTKITDALASLGVAHVHVNLATGEVKVIHEPTVSPETICRRLYDESYKPYTVITTNEDGQVINERSFQQRNSWLPWTSDHDPKSQERHIENCTSCRLSEPEERPGEYKLQDLDFNKPHSSETSLLQGSTVVARSPTDKDRQAWKLTLSVAGMTCASCASSISSALRDMAGVDKVNVDLQSNSCVVEFTDAPTLAREIQATIDDKGYDCELVELKVLSDEPPRIQAKLSIGGMTCAACSNSITAGIEQLPYVEKITVSLLTNSAIVVLKDQSKLDEVVEEVEDIGFDCSVESWSSMAISKDDSVTSQRQVDIKVHGMFCEHCPGRITNAIVSHFGSSVTIVNKPARKTGLLTVQYTPTPPKFTIRSILSLINDTHEAFIAEVYHPPSIEERSKKMQARERRRILMRLIFSFIAAIPTLLIGIIWMELVDKSNPMHMFFMKPLWGNASRSEWALFFIASPVYFFAADVFHTRALKEIRALWRPTSKTPFLRRLYRFGSMSLLISAGTSVAYFASIAKLGLDAAGPRKDDTSMSYFDAVVFLTFFILAGRYLEAFSKSNTSDAVTQLGKLRADKAVLAGNANDKGSEDRVIDADQLEVGDVVVVPHGSAPPADGIIVSGEGKFDEKSLTGESRLARKVVGDEVYTGTISAGEPVTIKVTKVGGASMLDTIVSVVREGLGTRAPIERFADVLTSYFVPAITAVAIVTWSIWLALGFSGALDEKILGDEAGGWAFWSLDFAIAVFVTACPCGIGLAAPTALFAGIGIAAKLGILVQGGGEAFQEAPYLDAIVFDKTGTLTEGGDIKVSDHTLIDVEEDDEPMIWSAVKALEEQSTHPIAKAITELASKGAKSTIQIESASEVPGRGLHCKFSIPDTDRIYEAAIGSQKHIDSLEPALVSNNLKATASLTEWQGQSKSVALFAMRDASDPDAKWQLKILFATSDPLRPSASPAIKELQRRGIKVFMLSGDHVRTAIAVGATLSLDEKNIFAGVLPTEKADIIKMLQRTLPSKRRHQQTGRGSWLRRALAPILGHPKPSQNSQNQQDSSTTNDTAGYALDLETGHQNNSETSSSNQQASVAFVGDGINDAPALLASSLSISMGTGAQIAMNSSQFILLPSDLALVPTLIDLSAKVYRRIKFNFAWALVYNVALVPIAAGVFFAVKEGGWRLGPIWASLAMALSSLSVVGSSLVLKVEGRWRYRDVMGRYA